MLTIVDLLCVSEGGINMGKWYTRIIKRTGLESFDSILATDPAFLHTTP
jgi:hypothetical protein